MSAAATGRGGGGGGRGAVAAAALGLGAAAAGAYAAHVAANTKASDLEPENGIPHGPMPYQFKPDSMDTGLVHKGSYLSPSSGGTPTMLHSGVYTDKRKVADVVTEVQTTDAGRAPNGQAGSDTRMTATPGSMPVAL